MWSALRKTQRRVVTLRYSPCDDTPTAATLALTTGVVTATNLQEHFFSFLTPPYDICTAAAILHLSLQLHAVTVAVSFLGIFVLNFRYTVFAV